MVLTENERTLTAYHEAGHAVLGLRIPGLDPVHKVTIVPRGRALGITASLPEEDRHTYTKEWLEGQLAMLFGGRVAEEMIFGLERVTTGAGNDIDRATSMARRMVTQFGMSDVIGLMSVGDQDHEVFLGRELSQRRGVSEHTARQVDTEVKRILDDAHERARELLEQERDLLERIAQALLERETLDRHEVRLLADGKELPPLEKLDIPGDPDAGPLLAGTGREKGDGEMGPPREEGGAEPRPPSVTDRDLPVEEMPPARTVEPAPGIQGAGSAEEDGEDDEEGGDRPGAQEELPLGGGEARRTLP